MDVLGPLQLGIPGGTELLVLLLLSPFVAIWWVLRHLTGDDDPSE